MHRLRLEEAVEMVARHADFTGKGRIVHRCVEEVEERYRNGRITHGARERLIRLLRDSLAAKDPG